MTAPIMPPTIGPTGEDWLEGDVFKTGGKEIEDLITVPVQEPRRFLYKRHPWPLI